MIKNLIVATFITLSAFIASAAEFPAKDGTVYMVDDSTQTVTTKEGAAVPDGTYDLQDGTSLSVKDGKKA